MHRAELNNTILVQVGEYRLRFHATNHAQAGKVYGYQVEAVGAVGWCLLDDDGGTMDAIPESIKADFRTICESLGRVW